MRENIPECYITKGAAIMKDVTKYVGLDVSKDKIAVAVADEGRDAPRYWGVIRNDSSSIRKLLSQLGDPEHLNICYEAGPTGYGIYRFLTSIGYQCMVVAPSLIPNRPGDRVKTDRRDAIRLAQLLRAGELTPVYVPTEEDEALRDLIRAREDVKEDILRAKHRLTKFLLRHDIHPPQGVRKWTKRYREWIEKLTFTNNSQRIVFQEYLHHLDELNQRMDRLENEIHQQATNGPHAPLIQSLQTLRGVAEITATGIVAEVGAFSRFPSARHFMSYAGLVPSEYSSGQTRRQGALTKTGNSHLRRLVVEAAWSYRYQPAVKGKLRKRQEGFSSDILSVSWKAQTRLHHKYCRLVSRGKPAGKAIAAVARELLGFIWAVARQTETVAS
jgi:transposase